MDKLIILCFATVLLVGLVAGAGHEDPESEHGPDEGHSDVHDEHEESECVKDLRACKDAYMMMQGNDDTVENKLRNLYTYYGCVERIDCQDAHDAERKANTLQNIGIDLETTPPIVTCGEMIKKCWDDFEKSRNFDGFISCVSGLQGMSDVCPMESMRAVNTLVQASQEFLGYLQMGSLCPGCSDTTCATGLEQCRQTFLAADKDDMELELVLAFHECVKGVACSEPAVGQPNYRENLRKAIEKMLMSAKNATEELQMCDHSIEECRKKYMEHGQDLMGTRTFKKCVTEAFCPGNEGIEHKKDLLEDIRKKIKGFRYEMNNASFMKPALVTMTLALVLGLLFK